MLPQETADEIIRAARRNGLTHEQTVRALESAERDFGSSQPAQAQAPEQSTSQKVADFLGLGTVKNNIDTIWNFGTDVTNIPGGDLRTGTKLIYVGRGQNKRSEEAAEASSKAFQQSQALIVQAKQTKDPVEKKRLLDASREIMNQSQDSMDAFRADLNQRQFDSGITEKDMGRGNLNFALRRGAGQSGELASWLLPAKVAPIAAIAGAPGRIATGAARGAVAGAGQGVARAAQADTIGQGVADIGVGTALGAGTGAAVQGGVEILKQALRPVKWAADKFSKQLDTDTLNDWRVTTLKDLRRNNFSDKDLVNNLDQLNRGNKEGLYAEVGEKVADAGKKLNAALPNEQFSPRKILDKVIKDLSSKQKYERVWQTLNPDDIIPDNFDKVSAADLYTWKQAVGRQAFGKSGTVGSSQMSKFNAALDAEIKKTLIAAAGKNGEAVKNAFSNLQLWLITEDAAQRFAATVGMPTSEFAQRASWLSFIPQTVGAVGSKAARSVRNSPKTDVVRNSMGAASNMIGNVASQVKDRSMVVPPAVSAMQRAIDDLRKKSY